MPDPTNSPNITADLFDKSKNYRAIRLQRGVPVLDADINAMQDYAGHNAREMLKGFLRGAGPLEGQVSPYEFAVRPAGFDDGANDVGASDRNVNNFGVNLGRLPTRLGLVDTRPLYNGTLAPYLLFDYKLAVDDGVNEAYDHQYANVMFTGAITAAGAGIADAVHDENKNWTDDHMLLGVASPNWDVAGGASITHETGMTTTLVNPCRVVPEEPACRVIVTSGLNVGEERTISARTSATELAVSSAFSNNFAEGDTYVIVPGNGLITQVSNYNAAPTSTDWPALGFGQALLIYAHVFVEDVSWDEDADLAVTNVPIETSHHQALRWCVRTMLIEMSNGTGGYDFVHPVHIQNLLSDGSELRLQKALLGSGFAADWSDSTRNGGFSLGEAIPYFGPNASDQITTAIAARDEDMFLAFLQGLIESQIGDNDNHCVVPLLFTTPEAKNSENVTAVGSQTLSPYFAADITLQNATDNQRIQLARTEVADDPEQQMSIWITPSRSAYDLAAVGSEIDRARRMLWQGDGMLARNLRIWPSTAPDDAGVIVHASSGRPHAFRSLSEHLGWLDMMVLGMTGLGGGFEKFSNNNNEPLPTSGLFTPSGTLPPSVAGQPYQKVIGTTAGLNSGVAFGQVHPPDLLAPDTNITKTGTVNNGTFRSGPAGFMLRDGTTVDWTSGDLSLNFYRYTGTFDDGTNEVPNMRMRGWAEGLGLGYEAREGLRFRKLALKTTVHREMDMFTIDVPPPTTVTTQNATTESDVRDYLAVDGYGGSSIGAFRNASEHSSANVARAIQMSYGGGTLGDDVPALSQARAQGDLTLGTITSAALQAPQTRALEHYDYSASAPSGAARMSASEGAWGRWTGVPDTADGGADLGYEMYDQWSNRCTAMRLRYHIGDYYPGAADDTGVKHNALVDSMKLFVRIEPLPLTHWMTMPKHQHTLLAGTVPLQGSLQNALDFGAGSGTTAHLLNGSDQPLVTALSPDRFGAGEGNVDTENLPFPHEHQLYVHWYHPFMESLTAPYPYHDSSAYGAGRGSGQVVAYHKFGERSMVIPSIVYQNTDGGTSGQDEVLMDTTDTTFIQNLSDNSNSANHNLATGTHGTVSGGGSGTSRTLTVGGVAVTYYDNAFQFPFIPREAEADFSADGYPGPIFLPAFRGFAKVDNLGAGVGDEGTNRLFNDTTQAMLNTAGIGSESNHFPSIDAQEYDASSLPVGESDWGTYNAWTLPVLRAAVRTDTVAKIVELVQTAYAVTWDESGAVDAYGNIASDFADRAPGVGPDVDVDTLFVGDIGTAVMMDSTATLSQAFYQNALMLGMPVDYTTGKLAPNADTDSGTIRDYFDLVRLERDAGVAQGGAPGTAFLPLINTWHALRYQGLQQKLLWNCSFRVLHVRPGGGYQPGATETRPPRSSEPKSLTEVFLMRDRVNDGNPIEWPVAPLTPADKPFIHLESIHRSADGGGSFNQHPNHPYIGHLYPMVSDSTGLTNTAPTAGDDLDDSGASPDHSFDGSAWDVHNWKSGAGGDTVVGDPFDREWSDWNAAQNLGTSSAPRTDRFFDNAGIEIDLLAELAYMRTNAGDFAADTAGFNSLTWLDFMPSAGELTAPGDHEIIFVLYTGKYGQTMIDNTVPNGYNAPIAGCHLVASLEINRPSDRASSSDGNGAHYGETLHTWNIPGTD